MRRAIVLVSLPSLLLLSACGFAHRSHRQAGGALLHPNDFVLQVDDHGSFWDPEIPARALASIAQSARTTNTIVILVVHGWHHSAAPDDENATAFARILEEIRTQLDDNVDGKPGFYRRSREMLTGSGDVNIFGIYVGWRGASLPMPLNFATFWDRKDAAERVGDGDLREFLLRLNGIYRTSYQDRLPLSPYVGMASIGHSFGAQVLFKAVSSTLEKELIDATSPPGASSPRRRLAKPIEGFGDIVVLVNPALEARQYERIRQLDAQLTYDRRQPPLLLVLSADTDVARRWFFPAGRWVDSFFNAPLRKGQADSWSQALGEYEPQRTHTIAFLPEHRESAAGYYISDSPGRPCDIVNFDLTDMPTIGHVRLAPIAGRHNPNSPFLVAYGGTELIRGHSGVFERDLHYFINDYIGITRGKRLLLAVPAMQYCPEPAPRELNQTP
jgi:hypothetical protein